MKKGDEKGVAAAAVTCIQQPQQQTTADRPTTTYATIRVHGGTVRYDTCADAALGVAFLHEARGRLAVAEPFVARAQQVHRVQGLGTARGQALATPLRAGLPREGAWCEREVRERWRGG